MSASTSSPSPGGPAAGTPPSPNVRWVLLGVMLAMLLSMLDTMVVGTAMPTIVGDLGGLRHISWVVTAYTLVTAVTTPVWGKLGDLYGRKHTYLASVAVFVVGSAVCGAAQTMTQLILARALQGIGAGGIGAGAFALIGALVPPRERGRYQGMSASVMAIGTIGGPLLGGFVTGHLGWRWAFYINLPLGVLAFVWLWVMLRLPVNRSKATIDWPGIALLTATITAAVLATTWAGTTYAWGSWQIVALGVATLVGLAGFIAWQKRATEPLMPLRIFAGHRNFPLALGMILVAGVVMFAGGLYLPLFQQTVQGASATNSGLLMVPMLVPVVIVSTVAGKVMSATGRYKIFPVLGAAFLTVGAALLATMDTETSRLVTCSYMVLIGLGLGCLMQMATTIAQNSVEMRDMGAAMSSTQLFRTLGGSLAVAAFGSMVTRAIQHHLPGGAADSGAPAALSAAARAAYVDGLADATRQIFLVIAILCAAAFAAALAVKEVPLKKAGPPRPATADGKVPVPTAD
ncbi:MDR family MFS transporter [Actinoallomurus liliacearum]|uniref:MDR family MFS transporter n=1 Tax=Actinoallomurus liliacearum TaxID=1080073 RepID=A0ABP8TKB3_9ACTN